MSLFTHDKKPYENILWIFLISLLVEITQYIFGVGASDIDDVILNSVGGFIGIVICKILSYMLKDENKVRFLITGVATIVGVAVLFFLTLELIRYI